MQDKDFKRFIIVYIANTVILFVAVIVLVLVSQEVIPEIFQTIAVVTMLASVLVYSRTTAKIARKDGIKRRK